MKFHKMVGTEVKPHIRPEKPVDNLKFTAYKKIANSFEEAEKLIKQKAPVLGEPIVVPFYYPSSEDENKTIELAFGIGTPESDRPYIISSINNYIGDEIRISDDDSSTGYVSLRDKLNTLSDDVFDEVIDNILTDEDFLNKLSTAILDNADKIEETIDRKINEKFVWKSLSDLID